MDNYQEYGDDYGLSVFALDETAINRLSQESTNFNNINQQTQVNYKIKGRASCLKTRLRGQTVENGGHFKELYSDGVSAFHLPPLSTSYIRTNIHITI